MKIGKYQFNSKEVADLKIRALGVSIDDEGNEYPTHNHSVVKLGNIILSEAEFDSNNKEIKAPIFSDKYHVDILWNGLNNHPFGWKSASINISHNGVHCFCGLDYQKNKF